MFEQAKMRTHKSFTPVARLGFFPKLVLADVSSGGIKTFHNRRFSSVVEHEFCKFAVIGSNPITGSIQITNT